MRVLPIAGGMIVGGPLGARLAERFGAKVVVAGGGSRSIGGAMALLRAGRRRTGRTRLIAAALALMGFGMGIAMSPGDRLDHGHAADEAHLSVGSAMNDTTRLVGGALGVAVLGSLMTSHYGDAMQSAPAAAQDSVGAAHAVAAHLPAAAGQCADGTPPTPRSSTRCTWCSTSASRSSRPASR